jgi:hypothetical protein
MDIIAKEKYPLMQGIEPQSPSLQLVSTEHPQVSYISKVNTDNEGFALFVSRKVLFSLFH